MEQLNREDGESIEDLRYVLTFVKFFCHWVGTGKALRVVLLKMVNGRTEVWITERCKVVRIYPC